MTGSSATRRHFLGAGAAAIAATALPLQLRAEAYPGRPISYVVPFPPGATNDSSGRIVARKLGEKLGQTIVVDGAMDDLKKRMQAALKRSSDDGAAVGGPAKRPRAAIQAFTPRA